MSFEVQADGPVSQGLYFVSGIFLTTL